MMEQGAGSVGGPEAAKAADGGLTPDHATTAALIASGQFVLIPVDLFERKGAFNNLYPGGAGAVHGFNDGHVVFEPDPAPSERDPVSLLRYVGEEVPLHVHTPLLDAVLEANVNAMLVGPTGTGKTTAAEYSAQESGLYLRSDYLHGGKDVAELIGFRDVTGHAKKTAVRYVFENKDGGVYLLDEFDAATPDVLVGINNLIDGREMEFPDGARLVRPEKFIVLACANTDGLGANEDYVARERQDAALLNRFAYVPWPKDLNLRDMRFLGELRDDNRAQTVGYPYDFQRFGGIYRPSGGGFDRTEDRVPSRLEWIEEVERCESLVMARGIRSVHLSDRTVDMGIRLAENGRFPLGMRWLTELLIVRGAGQEVRDMLDISYPVPQ